MCAADAPPVFTAAQLESLRRVRDSTAAADGAWADDEVVRAGMALVRRHAFDPQNARPALVISSLASELCLRLRADERTPRRIGLDVGALRAEPSAPLFLPLCSRHRAHWSLLVVCGADRHLAVHLDSAPGTNAPLASDVLAALLGAPALRNVVWPVRHRERPRSVLQCRSTPLQEGGWQCGFLVPLFAQLVVNISERYSDGVALTVRELGQALGAEARLVCTTESCRRLADVLLRWHTDK